MLLLALLLPLHALVEDALAEDALVEGDTQGPVVPAWVADSAVYRVRVDAEGKASLTLDYTFRPLRRDWMELRLVGSALSVRETDGPVLPAADGLHLVLGVLQAPVHVVVTGEPQAGTAGAARLPVFPAARQVVVIDAPGWDVQVAGAVGGALAGSAVLDLRWAPHHEVVPVPVTALLTAETSTAVWGEEGVLQVRSRVQWRVVRGETSAFSLDVAGLDEVDVQGANVARWSREGDTIVIEARAPVRGGFAVDVVARAALPAEAAVPAPTPRNVSRVGRYWTVARSEEGELLPVSAPRSVSLRSLPPWARGLSEAAPLAAWRGSAPLVLRAARYAPMMGPDTVVESAEFVVANSIEGRELLRSVWLVRNERRQYLHVTPAAGWRPLTARVSGDPVTVLSDGAGGLYVPLEKSVETVQGLMSFPVEVTWMTSDGAWTGRGSRRFELPAVDAPIQSATWSVHLPRSIAATHEATVSVDAVSDPRKEAARDSWLAAMSAYKENRFEEAQGWLDEAKRYDSSDENVARLQSNLDVLLEDQTVVSDTRVTGEISFGEGTSTGNDTDGDGLPDVADVYSWDEPTSGANAPDDTGIADGKWAAEDDGRSDDNRSDDNRADDNRSDDAEEKPEDLVVRRVRELANAKTAGQQVAQAEAEENARKALLAGDEDAASDYLETVVELSKQIGATVQKEDRAQSDKLSVALKNLEGVKYRKAEKAKAEEKDQPLAGMATTTSAGTSVEVRKSVLNYASHGGEVAEAGETYPVQAEEPAADESPVAYGPAPTEPPPPTEEASIVERDLEIADTEAAATISTEYLSRVPTGRTYESVVSAAPGVALGGHSRNRNEFRGAGKKAVPSGAAATPILIAPATAPPPPPAPPAKPAAMPEPEAAAPLQTPTTPVAGPAPRRALEVKASPLTPALPLEGATVAHTDALLAADTFPTFTVRYRTRKE